MHRQQSHRLLLEYLPWSGRTALLAGAALLTACRCHRSANAPGPHHPAAAALRVQWAGCATVRSGPLCQLGKDRTLTLWVAGPRHKALTARADETPLELSSVTRIGGGTRFKLALPPKTKILQLTDTGATRWQLRLEDKPVHPVLARADAVRKQGKLDQAEASLHQHMPELGREDRSQARALLARIALARGDITTAVQGLRRSLREARADGRVSHAVYDATALAFALAVRQRRFGAARRVLASVKQIAESAYPEGRTALPYFSGLVAWESGHTRSALRSLRTAALLAERLDLKTWRRHARQQIALTLALLGRTAEALEIERKLASDARDDAICNRAALYTNLAWIGSLAQRSAGTDSVFDPGPSFVRANQLLAACGNPFRRRNGLINEALWALERDKVDSAQQAIERMRSIEGGHNAQLSIWEIDVRGRLALSEGKARKAAALFERERQLAQSASHAEGLFRAEAGRGQALAQLGNLRQAVCAYRAAETVLDQWLDWIPMQEGRDAFLSERDLNARRLVASLIQLGRASEAATAARLARARLLRATARAERLAHLTPEQRERWDKAIGAYRRLRDEIEATAKQDWQLPSDALATVRAERRTRMQRIQSALDEAFEVLHQARRRGPRTLSAPAAGELLLVYFPGPANGWFGFVVDTRGTVAKRLGPIDLTASREDLAAKLLQPFGQAIENARRMRIYPYGKLQELDIHALPLGGEVLAEHTIVVYGADTAEAASSHEERPRPGAVLVVADPQGNLPQALAEGRNVLEALHALSPRLLSGATATRHATLRALSTSWLFHYAGHAWFRGVEGAESALELADGGRLLVGDILALPHPPHLVMLSSCESAQSKTKIARTPGLGLAQAFVLAGSRTVVAPQRDVADQTARQLTRMLYASLTRQPHQWDLAAALREAQHQLRTAAPETDWASFRTLVP